MENLSLNADFIRVWNEILVPKFARFRHILVDGFRGHSDEALASFCRETRNGPDALSFLHFFLDTYVCDVAYIRHAAQS